MEVNIKNMAALPGVNGMLAYWELQKRLTKTLACEIKNWIYTLEPFDFVMFDRPYVLDNKRAGKPLCLPAYIQKKYDHASALDANQVTDILFKYFAFVDSVNIHLFDSLYGLPCKPFSQLIIKRHICGKKHMIRAAEGMSTH